MFDKDLAYNLVSLIIENIETIQKRTTEILSANDFSSSESGAEKSGGRWNSKGTAIAYFPI